MATMHVTEYENLASDEKGFTIQAGKEPALTKQQVSYTATPGNSANFNTKTRFVRIICDADAYLDFGSGVTATTAVDTLVKANTVEFFGVVPGQRVSAVS